jgi:hypothetical protein
MASMNKIKLAYAQRHRTMVEERRTRYVVNPSTNLREPQHYTVKRYRDPFPGAPTLKAFARSLGASKVRGRWSATRALLRGA